MIKWIVKPCIIHADILKDNYAICVKCKAVHKINYKNYVYSHHGNV